MEPIAHFLPPLLSELDSKQSPFELDQALLLEVECNTIIQKVAQEHARLINSQNSLSDYFKRLLPPLLGFGIHIHRMVDVFINMPAAVSTRRHDYLLAELDKIEADRETDPELYKYFRLNGSDRDHELFDLTRNTVFSSQIPAWVFPFCPLPRGTFPYAQYNANERTTDWLTQFIYKERKTGTASGLGNDFIWSGTQAGLTELLYALNEMGVLGGTRHDINKLKRIFESVFSVNLGNIYKTYEHNRLRKKSRTPFIDSLKAALLRKMDEDDLYAL